MGRSGVIVSLCGFLSGRICASIGIWISRCSLSFLIAVLCITCHNIGARSKDFPTTTTAGLARIDGILCTRLHGKVELKWNNRVCRQPRAFGPQSRWSPTFLWQRDYQFMIFLIQNSSSVHLHHVPFYFWLSRSTHESIKLVIPSRFILHMIRVVNCPFPKMHFLLIVFGKMHFLLISKNEFISWNETWRNYKYAWN